MVWVIRIVWIWRSIRIIGVIRTIWSVLIPKFPILIRILVRVLIRILIIPLIWILVRIRVLILVL